MLKSGFLYQVILLMGFCIKGILFQPLFAQTQCSNANLNVGFSFPAPSGCGLPRNITFTNSTVTTSGSFRTTATYIWFVDGVYRDSAVGLANRTYTFNSAGSHTVRIVARATTGCLDTATQSFNIPAAILGVLDPPRVATRTLNPIWTRCNTNPNNLDNTFTINVITQAPDTLKSYTIIWGDATANTTGLTSPPGNFISHTYTTLGEFTVRIVNNNGSCIDTIIGTVRNLRPVTTTILPLPAGQLAGCAPHTITFQDSTGNALPGTIITWNFGAGQGSATRNHTQANTPIFYTYPKAASQTCVFAVSITATNINCPSPGQPSTTTISPILIYDVDDANIAVTTPLCDSTRTVTLQNTSTLNCEPGSRRWYWDFGDGTNTGWINSQASQVHVFPSFGLYTVMLVDSNFCGRDTAYLQITVNRRPAIGFTLNPKFGCAPLAVTCTDTTIGLGINRNWTFGTGSGIPNDTAISKLVTYTNPGTYIVTLSASNVCASRTRSDTVIVYAKPAITITGASNGCVPHTVNLNSNVLNVRNSTAQYLWKFKNGLTSNLKIPPPILYNSPTTDTVWLVVSDTCGKDSSFVVIRVSTLPTAAFTSTQVCRGDTTSFTNTSVLALGDVITAVKWFFGGTPNDSSIDSAPKYIYTNEGNFNAVLSITTDKGCIDFDTANVNVKIAPVVNITSVNNVCDTSIVLLDGTATTAVGTNIISFRWTFGNGINDTARIEDTSYRFPGPGVYTVRFRANNSINCGTTIAKNITVNPLPDARLFASNLCFGQLAQMRDSSTVGFGNTINQWQWDFNNDNIADSITQNPRFLFSSANTFKVKLRVGTNANCFNTDSINVTINPLPVVAISNNGNSKCKLDSFTYSNTTTGANTYRWRFGDATPDSITNSLVGIKKVYSDTGLFAIKMIATSALGCSDSSSFSVNVRPFPVALFTVNDTISCAPKTFTFNNTSILANNYFWRVNNTTTSNAISRPDTLIGTSGQTFQISLIATNIFGCRPDTARKTIQTISNPIPNFVTSKDSGCGPLEIDFTNSSIGATSFVWSLGNGNIATTTQANATYLASQQNDSVYQIKLVALNGPGCKDSITRTIRIFPKPVSSFTQNTAAGCGPLPVLFSNGSNHRFGGNIDSLQFLWRFGNGDTSMLKNPSSVFVASAIQDTNFTVRLVVTTRYGCKDTSQSSIKVFPNPRSQFTTSANSGCGPLSINFLNTSVPNDTGSINIMSFNWIFGNGNASNAVNPSQTYVSNLTKDSNYTARLIAFSEHGCRDTSTKNLLIFPKPTAAFTINQDSGCSPLNAVFTNQSVPNDTGDISIMSFTWLLGNGFGNVSVNSGAQYFSKPLSDSSYFVKLVAQSEHGCRDTIEKRVVAHPIPIASFTNNVSQGCGPLAVQFLSTSQLASIYRWKFGDGASANAINPQHIYASNDLFDSIYQVSLSVASIFGCNSDTVKGSIVVRANPIADFSLSSDSICGGGTISFNNQSLGGASNTWNFGNGQVAATINPIASFNGLTTRDTSYQIRLVVNSPFGCKDTAVKSVKVNPLPDAEIPLITPGCDPLTVAFGNTSSRAIRFEWDYGDGLTDTTAMPLKVFKGSAPLLNSQYLVTLNAFSTSGCKDTAKRVITVFPKPIAAFNSNFTEGCGPLPIQFNNQSSTNLTGSINMTSQWSFGNGQMSSIRNSTQTFDANLTKDTSYGVLLIVTSENGCKDTTSRFIKVFPKPKALFSIDDSAGCSPHNVLLTNQSFPNDTGSISIMNFVWDFGNGFNSVNQNAATTFNNITLRDSVFKVRLIASSEHGCKDTITKNNWVYPIPVASFNQNLSAGCGPFEVQFLNTSFISTKYNWRFGMVDSSSLLNPKKVFQSYPLFDTTYTITLVTESANGCKSDTAKRIVIGRYLPAASFITSKDSTCNPGSISFVNSSIGGSSNQWNFGNGNSSNSINPVVTFSGPLTKDTVYRTRLVVTSPNNCRDTTYKNLKVNPLPDAQFTSVIQGCTPLPILFSNNSSRAQSFEWDFGDGSSVNNSTSPLKQFTNNLALTNANYGVTLKAISASGCEDTARRNITVFPAPIVNYSANKTLRCDTAEFITLNTSQGAFTYQWKTSLPVVSIGFQPTLYFKTAPNNDSTYLLKLIGTTLNGCKDSITKPINIKPLVKADFGTSKLSSCANLMVDFSNKSKNASSYFWLFGDATGSPLTNPSHRYANTGNYTVSLIAYDAFGCTDTATKSNHINVFEVPSANFLFTPPQTALPNATIAFNNLSNINSGSLSYQWDFGDFQAVERTSTLTNPTFIFSDSGDYLVQLVARSDNSCFDTVYRNLRINPYPPIASFTLDPPKGCSPLTVNFNNTSEFADEYFWDFGDATQSTLKNPSHVYTFPNKYNVYLRVRGPGGLDDTTMTQVIEVFPLPRANFIVTPLNLIIPNSTITLTDISADAVRWKWNLSLDGQSYFQSTDQNTQYTFIKEGKYDVSLVAISKDGCADSLKRSQLVNVIKGGTQYIGNAFTPNGDGINDVFKPSLQGVIKENYELMIYDRWGKLVFKTNDINEGWNGEVDGKPSNSDVYVWLANGYYVGNISFNEKGNMTLMR